MDHASDLISTSYRIPHMLMTHVRNKTRNQQQVMLIRNVIKSVFYTK